MENEWAELWGIDKFNYLVIFRSIGGWNKKKMLVKTKGCEAVIAIDKCLSVTPIVKVYETVCESTLCIELKCGD